MELYAEKVRYLKGYSGLETRIKNLKTLKDKICDSVHPYLAPRTLLFDTVDLRHRDRAVSTELADVGPVLTNQN